MPKKKKIAVSEKSSKIIHSEKMTSKRTRQNKHQAVDRAGPFFLQDFDMLLLSEEAHKQLAETTGALNEMAGQQIIKTLLSGLSAFHFKKDEDRVDALNSAIALLHELNPQDATEGMISASMVMTFILNGLYLGREHLESSHKLMLNFNRLTETLSKYRNKGRQQITVQHVNVSDGANAVIGNVNQTRGG